MRKSYKKLTMFVALLSALVLLIGVMPVSYAAQTNSSVYKNISLGNNSYVQLTDANIVSSTKGATVSFTFTLYNGGNSDINLVDYWARLKSTSGTKYTLTLKDKETKSKVSPRSSETLTFYSEVGSNVTMDKLVLSFIKFDFSVSGYERTLGTFTFPASFTNEVKWGSHKTVDINGSKVNMRMSTVNVSKGTTHYNVNMTFAARNTGKSGVAIPEYKYYVETPSGLYPLTVKSVTDNNTSFEPTVLNTIRLSGEVPTSVSTKNWSLIITQKASEESTAELPIVIFNAPFTINNNGTTKTEFTDENGTYNVELQSVQRLPWAANDKIVAKVLVANNGKDYLPLPKLIGEMVIDSNITLTAQTVTNTGDLGLAPGESTTISFIGDITDNYEWKTFKLELSETDPDDSSATLELAELTRSNVTALYNVNTGGVYTQHSNGSQMSVKVTDTRTYSGDANNLYAVYMDVTNNETRSVQSPAFVGYFVTADGVYYEATIKKSTNLVTPSGKEQIVAYAKVPQSVDTASMQLILGEGFDANGLVKGTSDALTGYLRAVQFKLPTENTNTDNFSEVKVGPYTVNFDYFSANVNGTLNIGIGGTVTRDYSYDGFTQSTLLVELEHEESGTVLWSKTVDLEGESENSIHWEVGENFTSEKVETSSRVYSKYTLNIYETLDGEKKLLATTEGKFSSIENWLE
ncbi:hypothetical protein ACFSL6_06985 [Paenibacillus thailandensis]|uniref:Uncharacterized protein n=1 Tax=Paenibacillus thailandensis TaxID=393250 RepID=A0ABW5R3Y2_9BACL